MHRRGNGLCATESWFGLGYDCIGLRSCLESFNRWLRWSMCSLFFIQSGSSLWCRGRCKQGRFWTISWNNRIFRFFFTIYSHCFENVLRSHRCFRLANVLTMLNISDWGLSCANSSYRCHSIRRILIFLLLNLMNWGLSCVNSSYRCLSVRRLLASLW